VGMGLVISPSELRAPARRLLKKSGSVRAG
jgi:hypothetical protein